MTETKSFKSGDKIVYTPFVGCDERLLEYGTVTSTNDKYVFVKFKKFYDSTACRPSDLRIINE